MNKIKNINKDNIITISIITILITIALGSTYAYLNITSTNKTNNTKAGCFNVTYTGTTINTNNLTSSTNYTEGAKSTIVILINPFLTVDGDIHKSKLRFDAVVKLHNKDLCHLTFDSPSTPFDPTLHELKKID